eukprot:62512_1
MSLRSKLQNTNDSKSLWNYTLSPGWSSFDAHILRLAIIKYGCGAWRNIGRHFPLKNCTQLNLQTQRLFGQQALAPFNKVHVDPYQVKQVNDKIDGFRKNSCLINTGLHLSAKQREEKRKQHTKQYGIPKEIYERIQLPVVVDPPQEMETLIDDIEKLREMYCLVYDIELKMKHLKKQGYKVLSVPQLEKLDTCTDTKEIEENDIEMSDKNINHNTNTNIENKKESNINKECKIEAMDEDTALAMALSLSISNEKNVVKTKKKTNNTRKKKRRIVLKIKKKDKKRKNKWENDEPYVPKPKKRRIRKK